MPFVVACPCAYVLVCICIVPYELHDGDTVALGEATVCRVDVISAPDASLSVEEYLTAECDRMVQRVRRKADALTDTVRGEIDSALEEIKNTMA